ncbi:MAG: histidine triad nucleotide-binding protein [Spirochaetia bacterium]|nr:histidine triad nucleotide-binding protein [Spirochaetota bacterium]MCX8096400.1 histidine triad nucleotide-binding protein [Spirochaetota bacterium]MDW8112707.1 histidine triad nucleotide-binding protein [Spirochaetia bacterium]
MGVENCIFCKIVRKEIPSKIVYEDEDTLAFDDINPQAPVHTLVIPKKHIPNLMELEDSNLLSSIFRTIKQVVRIKNLENDGFRVVVNYLHKGGQTVFHLHFHILGGRQMTWPPG